MYTKNMNKNLTILSALIALTVAGCADDQAPQPQPTQRMLYICYTHATCDGTTVDQQHRLCADASDLDYLVAGDSQARDWITLWDGACRVDQGIVVPSAEREPGQVCTTSAGEPTTWGCDADCEPQFESCD